MGKIKVGFNIDEPEMNILVIESGTDNRVILAMTDEEFEIFLIKIKNQWELAKLEREKAIMEKLR